MTEKVWVPNVKFGPPEEYQAMPNVVVVGGEIQCSHGGVLQLQSGSDQLEIAGAGALTSGMEVGLSFAAGPGLLIPCPNPNKSPPPPTIPCTATMSATAGVSAQLTVGGLGALLDNASGLAVNAADPSATWSVADAGQTLLSVDQ
jgi:hypothetical protein